MDDDPNPGHAELLNEWGDDVPAPPRRTRAWLIGPLALVAVAAIVIAVVLGGTKRAAVDPVTSPTATTARSQPASSSTALSSSQATYDVSVSSSGGSISIGPAQAYTPEPIPSDAEAEPLVVSLIEQQPRISAAMVSFNVRVCVSARAASTNGSKVKVSRGGWTLAVRYEEVSPTGGGITPEFPDVTLLAAGECVSGYVSFPTSGDSKYIAIIYSDERFSWSWRVS